MAPKAKKRGREVPEGIVHIQATFNNTIISVTDLAGNALKQSSAGACGYKGARKSTPFAAQQAAEQVMRHVIDTNKMGKAVIHVSGPGQGRDAAMKAVQNSGVQVIRFTDRTPLPHNGCRPPKKRRV